MGLSERLSVSRLSHCMQRGCCSNQSEKRRGVTNKGYDADFTVFNLDVFAVAPDDLLKAEAVMTVIDDKIMYDKN